MIYGFLSTIVFFIILPFWLILGIFIPKLTAGFKTKLGFFELPEEIQGAIVFYGVSVGETIMLENIIRKTKETFSDKKIIVCTGTPTGQETAKKKMSDVADFITYFPFDFPFCINRFLSKVKPSVIITAETELWPNVAHITKKRNIPLLIVNGRISDGTYNIYKRLSFFFSRVLKNYTKILAKSVEDKEKFISLGANKTEFMGNLKFDIKAKECDFDLGNGRIIIAGSTHKGEDELFIPVFCELKKEFPDIKLLIAPRHPERQEEVKHIIEQSGLPYGLRTNNDKFDNKEIIMLDTMGELGKAYSLCYFAFIGGSFNKTGGHNPLEASIYNKPVISGSCIHNFKDVYKILCDLGAAKIVNNVEELKQEAKKLLSDETYYQKSINACQQAFEINGNAIEYAINTLKEILN